MQNIILYPLLSLIFFFTDIVYSHSQQILKLDKTFFSMGSNLHLKIEGTFKSHQELQEHVFKAVSQLQRFENQISTWSKDSQLSKFNLSKNNWFEFDPYVFTSLQKSVACSKISKGYFHPGLGKVIELWGLRNKLIIPNNEHLKLIEKELDLSQLNFNEKKFSIKKTQENFQFEEGGFAKGAGLDLLLSELSHEKIIKIELNFAGQIFINKESTIEISHPEDRNQSVISLNLTKSSISTSNISENKFMKEGKIYGHILNSKTLHPLEFSKKSLSVIHSNNLLADCLSTGLLVMSENKQELLQWMKTYPDYKVILIESTDNILLVTHSCQMKNKIHINKNNKQKIQLISNC